MLGGGDAGTWYRCSDVVVSMGTVVSPRFPARNHLSYTALPRLSAAPGTSARTGSNDLPPTHGDDDDDILSRSPLGRLGSRRSVFSALPCLRCVPMSRRRPLQFARCIIARFRLSCPAWIVNAELIMYVDDIGERLWSLL